MHEIIRRVIGALLLIISGASFSAQNFWQDVTLQSRQVKDQITSIRYFYADESALRDFLTRVPGELSGDNSHIIRLPMPDGTLVSYSIVESPIMEASLAAKYPEIKSYLVPVYDFKNDKSSPGRCSFKTIPNGLKQHPILVIIIHFATIYRVARKSFRYRVYFKVVNGNRFKNAE